MLDFQFTNMGVRSLPPYQTFLKSQKVFVTEQYNRFFKAFGYESQGISLLRYILQFVDMDYLDTQLNNYDRYRYHLRYIRKDLIETFDQVYTGHAKTDLFFTSKHFSTAEYLLPVEDLNAIINLPLDHDDWDTWSKVQPLRLWAYDSNEYSINIINDRVHFHEMEPSYAIELLDVIALVFKYYFWFKQQRLREEAIEIAVAAPQQFFLHKYVLCNWCYDLTDAWLMNMFTLLMNTPAEEVDTTFNYCNLTSNQRYGWIAMTSAPAFGYVKDLLVDASRNMRPEVIFDSKLLLQGPNGSINDRIRALNAELSLPRLQQYDWLKWLRDKSLYNFYCKVWEARYDLPTTRTYFRKWRRSFRRTLNHKPWNICDNVVLKSQIEDEMTQFFEWLDSHR